MNYPSLEIVFFTLFYFSKNRKDYIMKVNKLKGTFDFFGQEMEKFRYIESCAKDVCKYFGYQEIQTPIIEYTQVFSRGLGEETDIVSKEMYTFTDRSDKSITLRPEGTAAVTRAYVENKLYALSGLKKMFYFEPMFRHERPQAGRYRQFTQFGVEALGEESAYLDADTIYLGFIFLKKLGINNVKLNINTLGSSDGKVSYGEAVRNHFNKHIDTMCEDCKKRLSKNPLRILDCKIDKNHEAMMNAPKITDYLSDEDNNYFNKVLNLLDKLGVKYVIDNKLVRGLDYYNHTVFEFVYDDESSSINNLALLAGGRYNGLSTEFDGPHTPAIGFGCGVERIMIVLDELKLFKPSESLADVVVINIGEEYKIHSIDLANYLRCHNVRTEVDYVSSNLKPQFKLCDRVNARYIIIIGEEEVNNDCFKIKDTINKTENISSLESLNSIFNIEGEKYAYKK